MNSARPFSSLSKGAPLSMMYMGTLSCEAQATAMYRLCGSTGKPMSVSTTLLALLLSDRFQSSMALHMRHQHTMSPCAIGHTCTSTTLFGGSHVHLNNTGMMASTRLARTRRSPLAETQQCRMCDLLESSITLGLQTLQYQPDTAVFCGSTTTATVMYFHSIWTCVTLASNSRTCSDNQSSADRP